MNDKPFVFVAMPFGPTFNDEYSLAIKPACEDAGADCERVDDQIFFQNILDRIYSEIERADIVLGEMSERNTNVYYEIGYAHGIGKPVILITKAVEDIPFDLQHYPHVVHNGSLVALKAELHKRVRWCIDNIEEAAKQGPRYVAQAKALGIQRLWGYDKLSETLVDFFDVPDRNRIQSHLDIEVAVKEGGHIVLFYSLPLRVHIRRIEYFLDEKEMVFYSERNSRRSIGLPISENVSVYLKDAKEIHLIRMDPKTSHVYSECKVPFAVFSAPT